MKTIEPKERTATMKLAITNTAFALLGGFAAVAMALAPAAQDDSSTLAARVSSLERRVTRLEGAGSSHAPPDAAPPANAPDEPKWKDPAIWRRLSKGLSMVQVQRGLGEPTKIWTYGSLTTWYYGYPSGGEVKFEDGFVSGWSEP